MNIMEQIGQLNPAQQAAAQAELGSLLVLAGAGSGKTRVIINRIAWLIANGYASPHSVLAVTFTNKAASEMRARLGKILDDNVRSIWVGTFHGLAHKMLRMHWQEAGLPQQFQVIDSDEQLSIIKRIFRNLEIDDERWEPKKAQHFINRKKDDAKYAKQLGAAHSAYDQVMGDVYMHYEQICQESGLVDFADLLLRTYSLLNNNPDLLAHYQSRFQHFLVDEFQDTNTIQYMWLKLLAAKASSVTVVGDDDQSIYGWRGAKIENIKRFERDYTNTKVIRLEQNYRSTRTILSAANALIDNNSGRMGKTLWTDGEAGEKITVYAALNEDDESLFMVRHINQHLERGGSLQDICVLYRSNAQSRVIEEALVRMSIPYNIYGGLRFFERAEIRDALAYIRIAVNNEDDSAFERVINSPPRGIGKKSVEKLREMAEEQSTSLWVVANEAILTNAITGKARAGILDFIEIVQDISKTAADKSLVKVVEKAVSSSGLLKYYKEQTGEKAQSKAENLEELINATDDFEYEEGDPHFAELDPIIDFLAYTSLDSGDVQGAEKAAVQLMTLHSAKGLEFPVVFICGIEEGLFPHHFSAENDEKLEEERRLCYVGITRAMQKLYLTYAQRRRLFGREEPRRASRFINEIPSDLIEEKSRRLSVSRPAHYSLPISYPSVNPANSNNNGKPAGETGFAMGQQVKHSKFGVGTVVDFEGKGDRTRISVFFPDSGTKWLVLSYAKLEAVS